jgi:PH (Pleckstrin Homology) domain-containing protein/putative oligomerization/nucleic acid binding protein
MGYVEKLLAANEQVVVQSRQHWIVLARSFLANFFFVVVLFVLAAILLFTPLAPADLRTPAAVIAIVLTVFPVISFLRRFFVWQNEEYFVTNRRVIQASGIFSKRVLDSSLDKINDVALTQSFLGRILDYGNIEILTASEIGVNMLSKIASPVKFKMAMMDQKGMGGAFGGGSPGRDESDAAGLIKKLDDLHKQGILTDQEYQEKKSQLLAKL